MALESKKNPYDTKVITKSLNLSGILRTLVGLDITELLSFSRSVSGFTGFSSIKQWSSFLRTL